MLELEIIDILGDIIETILYINGDKGKAYHISFLIGDKIQITGSDVQDEYKSYETHARIALKGYDRKDLYAGRHIVSAWY